MADMDLPIEIGLEREKIARRQRMADMLMQQSFQPMQTQQPQGGFVVPVNPLAGIAKVMQAYMGAKMGNQNDADTAALSGRYQQGMSSALQDYQRTKDGTPGVAPQIDPQEVEQMADQGSPMPPNVGAVPGDPRAAVQQALMSQYAPVRELGKLDYTTQQQDKTRADERTFRAAESAEARAGRMQERAMALEAAAQNAALSREERASNAAQAAELRRELQQSQQTFMASQARQAAADRAALTGAGKTPPGYRMNPDGTMTAITGGPADLKAQAEAQKKATGSDDVGVALGTLRDAYDRLEKGDGITSTGNSAIGNAVASASSSSIGQSLGRAFGTQNQSARNDVAMARPALLAALMKATGMSSKQMDSNAELKLWLSTATDPTLDLEANRRALDNIERKYISGSRPAAGASGGWSVVR